jgi:hypothetical protein
LLVTDISEHVWFTKTLFPESHGTALSTSKTPVNPELAKKWICSSALDAKNYHKTIGDKINFLKQFVNCEQLKDGAQ